MQQILSKRLHDGDEACQAYAVSLLDKLEAVKVANAAEDAITDDLAAKAYMENFALEVFQRGDNDQRANKVTRQTADTFQAAAVFLDSLAIWGPLDIEEAKKSRFAKYHALRIAKAIKAGEDPNETNPRIEESAVEAGLTDEDGIVQELKELERQQNPGIYKSPTVESEPSNGMLSVTDSTAPTEIESTTAQPQLPERNSSIPEDPQLLKSDQQHDLSPIEPLQNPRHGSVGGGYFPTVPAEPVDQPDPAPDADMLNAHRDLTNIAQQPPPASMQAAQLFYANQQSSLPSQQQPPIQQSGIPGTVDHHDRPHRPSPGKIAAETPNKVRAQSPGDQQPMFHHHTPVQPILPAVASPPMQQPPSQQLPTSVQPQIDDPPANMGGVYRTDDESMMAAQKHAKWAVSALNFEDVGTAVKELRTALQLLGAT